MTATLPDQRRPRGTAKIISESHQLLGEGATVVLIAAHEPPRGWAARGDLPNGGRYTAWAGTLEQLRARVETDAGMGGWASWALVYPAGSAAGR